MKEVQFDIPTIKKLESELDKYFGFTHDDILFELSQVYIRKYFSLTPEEKELANQCRSEDGRINTVEFALSSQDIIYVRVTDDFPNCINPIRELCNDYKLIELDNGSDVFCILIFMAAIFNRDSNHLLDDTDYDYINEDYYKYIYKIRPDMLKLYIALCQKKRQINDKLKISIQGNSPTELKNNECWFEEMLKNYLNQYLGVDNKEEAQTELKTLYSDKQGRKTDNFYLNYIFTSIYLFVQENIIHSEPNKVTIEQCRFLHRYLTSLNFIGQEDKNNNLNNLQSTIKSLISSNVTPLCKYKLSKEFKASPNNTEDKLY